MTTTTMPLAAAPTMHAIVQKAYGTMEVLQHHEVKAPTAGPGEVVVKVRAAAMDRGTWHLMTGRPYLMRVMGFGFSRPKNEVAGLDVAGEVVAVGEGVTRFTVGDAVFGVAKGSFAELACAREDKLAHKPAAVSFEQAAVSGVSAITALEALRAAKLERGQRVLVLGASGGVGSFAVQLAVAQGAHVTGVCSAAKRGFVLGLGAEQALDYRAGDVLSGLQPFDVIFDAGGNTPVARLRRVMTPTGVLLFVGAENAGDWTGGLGRNLGAFLLAPFVSHRFVMVAAGERAEDLEAVAKLLEAGTLKPAIDQTFSLHEVPQAMARLEAGLVTGKLAIHVA
jgi:NADPH:quinone reductase-like Zn-dependent oxidoreductase